jgi:hypothetical protein
MLAADKQLLQTSLKQNAIALKEKECDGARRAAPAAHPPDA